MAAKSCQADQYFCSGRTCGHTKNHVSSNIPPVAPEICEQAHSKTLSLQSADERGIHSSSRSCPAAVTTTGLVHVPDF